MSKPKIVNIPGAMPGDNTIAIEMASGVVVVVGESDRKITVLAQKDDRYALLEIDEQMNVSDLGDKNDE